MHSNLRISIIVAVDKNGLIGANNRIPWKLKADLARFALLTKYRTVIVGRKTYESILQHIRQPLPNRHTIVITRNSKYTVPDTCEVATSLEKAFDKSPKDEEIFIIGGAEIYKLALPYATKIYLTQVSTEEQGDTHFPLGDINDDNWQLIYSDFHFADQNNEYHYKFKTFERKSSSFVNLNNTRHEDQKKIMEKIQQEEFCPFCPEHCEKSQLTPIIKQGKYWHIRSNKWPYKNTKLHLLLLHNKHAEKLADITHEAAQELFELLQWIEKEHQLQGGAIGLRFGDIRINGATVNHLHAHIICADITNRKHPNYKTVRFRMN
ncbi:MAG: dihydrofolate reductase [bacterium]